MGVIFGLVAEVIILLWFSDEKSRLENALLIAATLIIAAGVWVEDHFAHKAGGATERLTKLSDERIAESERLAGEANERAAGLEKEAAALALELERTKALLRWRTISPTQAASIIAELRGSGLRVTLAVDSDEPEAAKFGKAVEVVLRGARVLTGMRRGSIGTTRGPAIPPGLNVCGEPGADQLRRAFENALVVPIRKEPLPSFIRGDGLNLAVGSRPEPEV